MTGLTKMASVICLVGVIGFGGGCDHDPAAYQRFCTDTDNPSRWHLVIYVDIDACLACNEDMDTWRDLVATLRKDHTGKISVYAPQEDSSDVYWAMKLEEITDTVRVLEPEIVDALGWDDLGTPVKVLLDSNCQPIEIGGRMGNKRDARCFIEEIQARINRTGLLASVPDN